jgi:hypothetical protein
MTDLAAHGIEISLPSGWEGRVFRRPAAGEVGALDADGPPAPSGETTHAVVHVSTIALPPDIGDFASGAVDKLGADDALIVVFEYDPGSVDTPLFAKAGIPRELAPDDFSPNVMQRAIRGQAGVQKFFNDQGRAFCLYVVVGSYARRRQIVPQVNQVLATLTIESLGASSSGTPSTTTTAPPTTAEPTTEVPTTAAPTTDAPDSSGAGAP